MSVIELDGVSKHFRDVVALSDVTLRFPSGMSAILGPNGAGKSTLLRLMVGLARPTAGSVRLFGQDPRSDEQLFRRVGLVPQGEKLLEHLDARAFVRSAAELHGLVDADAAAVRALQVVELDPTLERRLSTYSKGMRQRVKLAQAIVHDPEVVVLDEPLNGLDPRQRARTIEVFRRLAADERTVLVSSHVLDEVERFGSHIVVLVQGRLAAEGDVHEVRRLLNDRPLRFRIVTDQPRRLGSALLRRDLADGVDVLDEHELHVETADAPRFARAIIGAAQEDGVRLEEIVPLDDDLESVFRYLVSRRRA